MCFQKRKEPDISRVLFSYCIAIRGWLSIWDGCYQTPQAASKAEQEKDQPSLHCLAPNRGLPSQHLSMLLVRSYRTFAPLPVGDAPSAVCFCGTILTVARTGRYPASLVFREPGLSSALWKFHNAATSSPALSHS
jgi:hypothetical protein